MAVGIEKTESLLPPPQLKERKINKKKQKKKEAKEKICQGQNGFLRIVL